MSFDSAARDRDPGLDFSDLVDAANQGLLKSAVINQKRERNCSAKKRLTQASMMAPLLAAQGCLTLGGKDSPVAADARSGGGGSAQPPASSGGGSTGAPQPAAVQAADDSNFNAQTDSGIQISTADLLANDAAPQGAELELVRVFGAVNGTVMLHDGVVHFTPNSGFEGAASFRYEVRDSLGNISEAGVEINVGEHMKGPHGGDNGGDMHGGHDHGGMAHPDDPGKASEHMAVLSLVPVSEATHVAVNNGSWFDPNTWANGEVPGEGAKVLIPQGVRVAYDGESTASLFTVRVDGALDFATDQNTFMEVDTLIVAPSGRMTIGTADNPVAANVETIIQIADNGPIDVAWDPMLLSRGVVSHGAIEIHGAEKEAFLKVAADPMKGDTSIVLAEAPEGWQVGDKLVLTGTNLTPTENVEATQPRNDTTEDEELIITRIDGNTIYFDKPLEFDHDTPRADLKAYVANYTRNVRFETENASALPEHQRGHVMLMHSDDIDVRYAEFHELGRTDKSERAFDLDDINNIASDSNVKGRYSLHIHRAGVSDPDDPAYLVGNAVWGSPGWGFVHHDSNAILTDNAAYDVFGAAFVAETGNEIGRWASNIAIKSIGTGGGAKWHEDVAAFDLGRTGAGFWFQGRLVDATDNVAAGMPGGHGFVYMSRGNSTIPVDVATVDLPESLRYSETTPINFPAISGFDGNEAIAVNVGLEVIKGNSEQGHDVHTQIENFTAWEVSTGAHLQYTAHYTLRNIDLIATDQSSGAGPSWRGIEYGPNAVDMVVVNARVDGFTQGVAYSKEARNMNFPFDGDWGYVFIDVEVVNSPSPWPTRGADDLFLTGDQLVEGRLSLDSAFDGIIDMPVPERREFFDLEGTKTDSIGSTNISHTWDPARYDYFAVQGAIMNEGYWTLPDGRKVTVIDQYFTDRATGEIDKIAVLVEWERDFSDFPSQPTYNGVLDMNSNAPVARTDFATTGEDQSIVIDVLSNDFDPDGDRLQVDGFVQPTHGAVYQNDDGTLTYAPDPNYTGTDEFWYWVEDEHGNFAKSQVQVTVEV